MLKPRLLMLSFIAACLMAIPVARAQVAPTPEQLRQLVEGAQPSIVIIKYAWEGEANRQELEGVGLVVSEDGLVMAPLDLVPVVLPDSQVKEFQILIPQETGDPRELKATRQGRDERSNLVFVKADPVAEGEEPVKWQPVKWSFEKPAVGEYVASVGRLPEEAGYTPYIYASRMAANLRGPVPLSVVDGQLTSSGSVVLDMEGQAVGLVERIGRRSPFLTGADTLET